MAAWGDGWRRRKCARVMVRITAEQPAVDDTWFFGDGDTWASGY